MSRPRLTLQHGLLFSMVAALTCWVTLFAWRGFVSDSANYLAPLLTYAVLMAGLGALARWARVPVLLVPLLQLLLLGAWLLNQYGGHGPLPTPDNLDALTEAFRHAVDSANTYRAPVPRSAPTVTPVLVAGGGACLIMVDLLAAGLGRVPLSGLPLLLVYSLPVSIVGSSINWIVFVLVASGFLTLLFLREDERFSQWGRQVQADPRGGDPTGFGVRTGSARSNAVAIGSTVTALALFVPAVIPELDVNLFSGGIGSGHGPGTTIINPIADLRTDLRRGPDVPLLTVTTDDPDPSYFKIAVLGNFNGDAWTTGDRHLDDGQSANGQAMPPLPGLNPLVVDTTAYRYELSSTDDLDFTWLPVPEHVISADAPGLWRYDTSTRDFISGDPSQYADELTWTANGIVPDYDVDALASARTPADSALQDYYTSLPLTGNTIPEVVRNIAADQTRDEGTKYEKAVALQNYLRSDLFHYTTDVNVGNGSSNLAEFLSPEGRRGYCEQFASAFAVMARVLDIPTRVVIGFLNPSNVGPDTYEFSSHDLHAWPEVYFEGSGWVRFEPTPGNTAEAPAFTGEPVTNAPSGPTSSAAQPSNDLPTSRAPSAPASGPDEAFGSSESGFPWLTVLGTGAGLLVLLVLSLVPQLVRRRRRRLRWSLGTAEAAWAELRDCVVDLGRPWPAGRSPQEIGGVVAPQLAALDGSLRPPQGRSANPEAAAALDRLVRAVELERYSGRALVVDPAELESDVDTCTAALAAGVSTAQRRKARWLPRSLRGRRPVSEGLNRMRSARDNVVDHVG